MSGLPHVEKIAVDVVLQDESRRIKPSIQSRQQKCASNRFGKPRIPGHQRFAPSVDSLFAQTHTLREISKAGESVPSLHANICSDKMWSPKGVNAQPSHTQFLVQKGKL